MKQDWDILERVFSEALELPPEQRLRFVRERSGDNLWLLRELESLLQVSDSEADEAFNSGTGILRELLTALDSEYAIGREVGKYRIESLISSGGMGIVYKGVEMATGELVALKLLPPEDNQNPKRIRRLAREAGALEKLSHPGIVRIKEYSPQPGCHFLVMELVVGETLQTRLAAGPVPLGQALDWGAQIAAAVEAAHEQGVVHRDLKPSNIMIESATGRVKLLDFGLARVAGVAASLHSQTTVDGTIAGTFSYFSPEQANGQRGDERSDIFSFGAVFYEMIAGRRPFERPGALAIAAAVLNEPPDPLPAIVPKAVRGFIERCLEKQPARRYATAREVGEEIGKLRNLARHGRLNPPMPVRTRLKIMVAAALVASVGARWYVAVRPVAASVRRSIAVLPFTARSSDPGSQYLSVGLTEELTQDLSRMTMLRVIAPASAKQFHSTPVDLHQVGNLLHVDNVLLGSVEREGDRFKLVARLERVSDGAILWSNTYQRLALDLTAVQSDLAQGVARSLKVVETHAAAKHVPKPQAHEFLMKGRFEAEQMTPEVLSQAEVDFQHAIDLDPEYALAYFDSGTAKYNQSLARGSMPRTGEERQGVEELIHKALELDPRLPSAHSTLARLAMQYDWDWDGAERELLNAPQGTSAEIEETYAFLRLYQGRIPEADEHIRSRQDLDPFSTSSMMNVAAMRNLEGRIGEAHDMARKLLALYPNVLSAKILIAGTDIELGETDLALREIEDWPDFRGKPLYQAMAYAKSGRRDEALRLIRPLEEKYPEPGVTIQWFALVYGVLGDAPNTVKWLERSAARHEWQALNLAINPVFAKVRTAPAFRALETRMGLLH